MVFNVNLKGNIVFINVLCLVFISFSVALFVKYHQELETVYVFLLSMNCILPLVIIILSVLLWYNTHTLIESTAYKTEYENRIIRLQSDHQREINDLKN
jgi:hypothetical protein